MTRPGERLTVHAPATLANVGPGFDVFGLALEGLGDQVEIWPREEPGVLLEAVEGDRGRLPVSAGENTAGIAALGAYQLLREREGGPGRGGPPGFGLRLVKGIPLASGLGSSAASAAAAARAVSELYPGLLGDRELLVPCLAAEALVSGRHLDNVAPALLGGFQLVQGLDPLRVHSLPTPFEVHLVVAKPDVELPTRESRAALPTEVPLDLATANLADAVSLVHALHSGDRELFAASLRDRLVAPVRASCIPGAEEVWEAAREAGAEAVGVSGGGPTLFSLVPDPGCGERVAEAMESTWSDLGMGAAVHRTRLSREGARRVQ